MLRLVHALIAVIVLLASSALAASTAEPIVPAPFTATYAISYRGLQAGLLIFELKAAGEGGFSYETRPQPSLLARIIVDKKAVERSVMRIDSAGVRPLSWHLDDGRPGEVNDGALVFAWDERRVSGTIDGQSIQLPTEPGLQDRLSLQIAVLTALVRGDEPGTLPMIDRDKIKRYSYRRIGTEQIKTPAGEFDTVQYESTRPGSNRVSRIWHAPALGYLAVRVEQLRKGKVETVMELIEVERGDR